MFRILIISIITFILVIIIFLLFISLNPPIEKFSIDSDTIKKKMLKLITDNPPWGIYISDDLNGNILKDRSGNKRDATTSGTITTKTSDGYGATGKISYITGGTNANIVWPNGSIPPIFTIMSLTRYTGGSRGRIIESISGNWLHGHWNSRRGMCFYEGWKTQYDKSIGNLDNWLCCIGNNGSDLNKPDNILLDGTPFGTDTRGTGNYTLSLNKNPWGTELSDWAFNSIIIWDKSLSKENMLVLNNIIEYYKSTGGNLYDYYTDIANLSFDSEDEKKEITNIVYNLNNKAYEFNTIIDSSIEGGIRDGLLSGKFDFKNQIDYSVSPWSAIINTDRDYIRNGNYIILQVPKISILRKYMIMTSDKNKAPAEWCIYGMSKNKENTIILTQITSQKVTKSDYDGFNNKTDYTYINFTLNNIIEAGAYVIVFRSIIDGSNNNNLNITRIRLDEGEKSNIVSTSKDLLSESLN